MLDNLLKKNPVLGVIIYPLLGLGAIWLGHYYSQSLSLLEKTGGQLKVNTFVYIAYQLGGIKLVMGFFILLALFFFYLGYTYFKKLGNTQNKDHGYTSTAAACLQFFSFLTGQPESPFYAKIKVLRFKKEMR